MNDSSEMNLKAVYTLQSGNTCSKFQIFQHFLFIFFKDIFLYIGSQNVFIGVIQF